MVILFTLLAKKADRNNIFRKRKLSRKKYPYTSCKWRLLKGVCLSCDEILQKFSV